jgi:hypothetical protein
MSELTASIHQFKLFELRVIVFLLFHIWDLRKPLCEGGGGGGGGVEKKIEYTKKVKNLSFG